VAIIVPYLFAYASGGFWTKEQIYFEHADVRFDGDIILGILDDEGRTGIWSTNQGIN
jgi:hypothetical protein